VKLLLIYISHKASIDFTDFVLHPFLSTVQLLSFSLPVKNFNEVRLSLFHDLENLLDPAVYLLESSLFKPAL
jgi:hypothetical protein